jgi:hypothetical protein
MKEMTKAWFDAVDYRVTGGSSFLWRCFGDWVQMVESETETGNSTLVLDRKTGEVYYIETWDERAGRTYRWFSTEENKQAYNREAQEKRVNESYVILLETSGDILEKTQAIMNGEEYDERVVVPLDFTDAEFLILAKKAHEADMTFNEYITEALKTALDEMKNA